MTEKPILFLAPMVRAILEGRKTMTRRVIRINDTAYGEDHTVNHNDEITEVFPPDKTPLWSFGLTWHVLGIRHHDVAHIKCPYGRVGDRLWVRETINCIRERADGYDNFDAIYTADQKNFDIDYSVDRSDHEEWFMSYRRWWQQNKDNQIISAIHMPRWASRINLEITNIRVERLQGISEYDAKKEGATPGYYKESDKSYNTWRDCTDEQMLSFGGNYRDGFRFLWDSINGKKYPWSSNFWVWVIEFKRCE